MKKILVTGGCGYIGSHAIVDLIENGYEVVSVDNNSRSFEQIIHQVEKIVNKKIQNYHVNLCNFEDIHAIFQEHPDITGIIHFAAYKSVNESVREPLMYYQNNLTSLINILRCVEEYGVQHFIFSSSCTVYGSPEAIPVTEETPLQKAESPYGMTKQMNEDIIFDFAKVNLDTQFIILRYFNPVGAHPSALIGELPLGRPENLVPAITQTAIGKLPQMTVHGTDYNTRDGSCIRDYVHVCDLVAAHTLALKYVEEERNKTNCEVFNLGTGNGITVLESIAAFEKVSNVKLNYVVGKRREGDIVAIYANNNLAKEKLHWQPKYSLDDMMLTAWKWEQRIKDEQMNFKIN